ETDRCPRVTHVEDARYAVSDSRVASRTMANSRMGLAENTNVLVVKVNQMGKPDVRPGPSHIGRVLQRAKIVPFAANFDVVGAFCEVRMHSQPEAPRLRGKLTKLTSFEREGEARRCDDDTLCRCGRRIMPARCETRYIGHHVREWLGKHGERVGRCRRPLA